MCYPEICSLNERSPKVGNRAMHLMTLPFVFIDRRMELQPNAGVYIPAEMYSDLTDYENTPEDCSWSLLYSGILLSSPLNRQQERDSLRSRGWEWSSPSRIGSEWWPRQTPWVFWRLPPPWWSGALKLLWWGRQYRLLQAYWCICDPCWTWKTALFQKHSRWGRNSSLFPFIKIYFSINLAIKDKFAGSLKKLILLFLHSIKKLMEVYW